MNLLAIDLGTTGVRAVCYDTSKGEVGSAYQKLEAFYPQLGWVEQNPTEMFRQSVEVATAAASGRPIDAVGLVCQRGTAIAWDRSTGKALAPAIGWQDQRTLSRVRELIALGIPVNTLAACSKFEWLVQEVPEVIAAAEKGVLALGTPDAWLAYCLSGGVALVTDPSNAGATGLLDNARGEWMPLAMELFHQDPAWHMQVIPTDQICGTTHLVTSDRDVPLAARAGDQQAACFAHGVKPGEGKLSLGTSAMLNVHTGTTLCEPPDGAYGLPLWTLTGERAQFCLEGSVITAGDAVEWLVRIGMLGKVADFSAVTWQIDAAPLFLPALQGLGTPYVEQDVRGAFLNLALDSDRNSLLQAVLSGLAHRCCDLLDALGSGSKPEIQSDLAAIYVDGGLSRSDQLCQAIADLTGVVVKQPAQSEMTAFGAVRLAARVVGVSDQGFTHTAYREYRRTAAETKVQQARERWTVAVARFLPQPSPVDAA